MKRTIFTLFLSIVFLSLYAQTASNLLNSISTPRDTSASNYLFVHKVPGFDFNRIYPAKMDSLKLKPWNLIWLTDTIYAKGDLRYAMLLGAYSNPAFVNSLSAAKVFGLSSVATTGDYNDLTNKPNLSLYYLASNPNGYISGITGPMINGALGYIPYNSSNPDGYINNSALNPYLKIIDTANKWLPIGTIIPNAQVNCDWNATTGIAQILNKPTLFSGSYNNLVDTPILNINNWNTAFSWGNHAIQGYLKGTDTISLSNRINTKQNQLNGTGFVKATGSVISYDNSTYLTTETDPLFDTKFAGKSTTNLIEGTNLYYTDVRARNAISLTTTGSGAATYVSGILNIPTPPSMNRQERYSGTTDASGNYTVTFATSYPVAPNIQASISNQSTTNQTIRVSSVTTTGFTVNVYQRSAVTLLGIEVLLAATTNVSGATVDVLVTQK